MDNTRRIGILLLSLTFLLWYWYTAPSPEELERYKQVQDSIKQAQIVSQDTFIQTQNQTTQIIPQSDSVVQSQLSSQFGPFGNAMSGTPEEVTLENDVLALTFTSQGGRIKQALLKKHKKIIQDEDFNETKVPVILMANEKNRFDFTIPTERYGRINSNALNFKPVLNGNQVTLTAQLSEGQSIVQKYTLQDSGYMVAHKLQLNGIDQLIDSSNPRLNFKWHNYLDKLELNTDFEKYYSTVYYKENGENSDYCNCRADDDKKVDESKIEWVSHVNQFFNSSFVSGNKQFENGYFETVTNNLGDEELKLVKSEFDIPLDLVATEFVESSFYIGPNEFERLLVYDKGLEEIIPFGRSIFGTINRWVIRPAFNWLSQFIGSKGVVIIVLIFILKMLLYPLMFKMLQSQAKMGVLKPRLAGLKEKFEGDSQKVQMETMKIYREYGVSPLGGCMPMVVQMPIWYALFRFFPASITFRQEPFLWATDLSSFDVLTRLPFDIPAFGAHISLFTVLWALSSIAYSYYNMRHMDFSANPAMKYIQYIMPFTFLFFFNNYASGLTCYMFFSNLFTVGQTVLTKKFVFDDDKMLAELEAEKAKPKKKGGFQQRLEEAMKQQQQTQKQKASQAKKKKKR